MGRRTIAVALVSLAVLVGLSLGGLWVILQAREASRTYLVRVPLGTAERIAAGEAVEVFPQTIELKLGEKDILVIRNDDREAVTVGPFRIEPGQRFIQRYEGPGTFDLICSIHGAEGLRIVVTR